MKESVFFIADIHKTSIQAGHDFFHLGRIDVADREGSILGFALKFHEVLIFQ